MRYFSILFLIAGLTMNVQSQFLESDQMIVVLSDSWTSQYGVLYTFEKNSSGWSFQNSIDHVALGKNGMAWGVGLHAVSEDGPWKREGDKKSPAGIFYLGALYGWGKEAPSGVTYPYHPITESLRCVDDAMSPFYNMILEENDSHRWNSAEKMKIRDYKYLFVIEHNPNREPNKGSCIFLHLTATPTVGCTAISENSMTTLMRWARPDKRILIVQAPMNEYLKLQKLYSLPSPPSLSHE